jgi:proteasome lid subunit RPN8/RPN11
MVGCGSTSESFIDKCEESIREESNENVPREVVQTSLTNSQHANNSSEVRMAESHPAGEQTEGTYVDKNVSLFWCQTVAVTSIYLFLLV